MCLGATAKLGPCASRETCTSVNGVLDRFLTHQFIYSLVVVSVVVEVVAGVSSVDGVSMASAGNISPCSLYLVFEWPFVVSCFDWSPLNLCHNRSNFDKCLSILKKIGVIYRYRCGRADYEEEYIGESGRTFGERYRKDIIHHGPSEHHRL